MFSISSIGQNRKLGKHGNYNFFLLNHIVTLKFPLFLVIFLVFRSSVSCTTKKWSKVETAKRQTVSINQQHFTFFSYLSFQKFFLLKPQV